MRDPEKQRKNKKPTKASKSTKVYPKKTYSSKAKANLRKAAQKANESKKERWDSALKAIPIEQALVHLKLQAQGKTICPHCQAQNSLQIENEQNSYRCEKCKKKGNLIILVKAAKNITQWKAVAFIEELATSLENPQEIAKKNNHKEQINKQVNPNQTNPTLAKENTTLEKKPISPIPKTNTTPKKEQSLSTNFPKIPSYNSHPFKDRIQRVKDANPIEDVVANITGVSFKKTGSNLVCNCPFPDHQDKTPSFNIRRQGFKCFGCDKSGDIFTFLMLYKDITFVQALDYLDPAGKATGVAQAIPALASSGINQLELIKRCCDFFHTRLAESLDAKTFLHDRGLWSAELVNHFKLGFDDGWINRTLSEEVKYSLKEMGYLNGKDNFRFYRCLTVGLEDENGNTLGLYGRRIEANGKGAKHQFAKGKIQGLFNPIAIKASNELILTEGVIDALSVWLMGYRNVSCIFSASTISETLIDLIINSHVKKIYLGPDNDKNGETACEKIAHLLSKTKIELKRIHFPKGIKDANELLMELKLEKAKTRFSQLIEQATPISYQPNQEQTHSPILPPKSPQKTMEVKKQEIEFLLEDRHYRIRGFEKNNSFDSIRINIRVFLKDRFHVDTFDLYNARGRSAFIKCTAQELGLNQDIIKRDIGHILVKLEKLQEEQINENIKPENKEIVLSPEEEAQARLYLSSPNLLERICDDYQTCGLVGERTNILMIYLALTSRKLPDPLAVVIQALSAAGKTALLNAGLAFAPPEDVAKYTAVSGQSLFYMGEKSLVHKILAIVEEEGAEKATYSLKVFQSEKKLCMASTGKNPKSGKFVTHQYNVEGPAAIFLTTASVELDEEFVNRCLLVSADEKREQTQLIQQKQRQKETLQGKLSQRKRERIIKLHQNIQRLIKPIMVVNPYAEHLTFADTRLRTRRDHLKYLTIISTIALLHQYQRPIKKTKDGQEIVPYIEVTLDDIEAANSIVAEVLGTSLDELPPQTRRFLRLITKMVKEKCKQEEVEQERFHFTRKMARDYTGWSDFQVRTHLRKLVDLEYMLIRGGNGGSQHFYELLYSGEGEDGKSFYMCLIDVDKLRKKLGENNQG